MCASALSALGFQSPAFFSSPETSLDKFLVDSDTQNVYNLCYAVGVLDVCVSSHSTMLTKPWNELIQRTIGDLSDEGLTQIHFIQAYASVNGIELASPSSELQRQLNAISFSTQSSGFEDGVSNALLRIGFSHEREISPFESIPGLLSIDIVCKDRMVAIECDGPSHFVSTLYGGTERENGPTKAKRRLLQKLGWNVINLNWKEAKQHKMSEKWVRDKLLEAGVEMCTQLNAVDTVES
jgi:RAP domain